MQQRSDYVVLTLIVFSTMITTALGAHVAGFDLPPVVIFGLLVGGSPIPVVIAVLPQLGIRVPRLPDQNTLLVAPSIGETTAVTAPAPAPAPAAPSLTELRP